MARINVSINKHTPWNAEYNAKTWQSLHNLKFKTRPHQSGAQEYEIGTCRGLWQETPISIEVAGIINSTGGNSHAVDVLQWFQTLSRQANKPLRFVKLIDNAMKEALIRDFGFIETGNASEVLWDARLPKNSRLLEK